MASDANAYTNGWKAKAAAFIALHLEQIISLTFSNNLSVISKPFISRCAASVGGHHLIAGGTKIATITTDVEQ
jgi:hypothetical protein